MGFIIPTRQKADRLFESDEPLGPGEEVCLDARTVAGYDQIRILATADQPFRVRVQEGCSCEGPFGVTTTLTSVPGSVAGTHVLCESVQPCGSHMVLCPANTGPSVMTSFSLCGEGIPQP